MAKQELLFEEKQYLGHNRFSIVIRTALTIFCFLAYYWSQNPKPVQFSFFKLGSYPLDRDSSGLIFFVMGLSILVLSAGLTFVLHIQTIIEPAIVKRIGRVFGLHLQEFRHAQQEAGELVAANRRALTADDIARERRG